MKVKECQFPSNDPLFQRHKQTRNYSRLMTPRIPTAHTLHIVCASLGASGRIRTCNLLSLFYGAHRCFTIKLPKHMCGASHLVTAPFPPHSGEHPHPYLKRPSVCLRVCWYYLHTSPAQLAPRFFHSLYESDSNFRNMQIIGRK